MNKHKHRFMTFCSRAAMLLCSLVLVGLCVGSFSYIAYMGAGEAVQFLPITFSSRIYGVLALLGAGLALAWAAQYEEFRRWTTVIALCLVMAEAAFWLWATAPTPAADSMACLQAAANAIAGNWVDFQQGGYLYLFPYQIGLVALDEAMIRLFGWEGALAALRCLNLAALGLLAVSLTAIARLFNTTVNAIVRLNDIDNPDLIFPGQRLYLRVPADTPIACCDTYTVRRGDTLTAIAARFGTTVDRLVAINQIPDEDLIVIGQVLTLGLCPAES